jgi:hypothetical protein
VAPAWIIFQGVHPVKTFSFSHRQGGNNSLEQEIVKWHPPVTGRQSHIGYTSLEKRIRPSNRTNGCIDKDLKLRKEEEGERRREVSYIYTLRSQVI